MTEEAKDMVMVKNHPITVNITQNLWFILLCFITTMMLPGPCVNVSILLSDSRGGSGCVEIHN